MSGGEVRTTDGLRWSAGVALDRRRLAAGAGAAAALVGAWVVVAREAVNPPPALAESLDRALTFLDRLLGGTTDTPAWAQGEAWRAIAPHALDTVVMSVLAVGIAGAGALATVTWASRLLTVGEFAPRNRHVGRAALALVRGLHAVTRAVPEYIWALLAVFVLRPGVVAGAAALALHEVGVLGRLGSDVVDDLDRETLRALRSSGAGNRTILLYGVLPQALPQFTTFLLYRWEVVMRATVVVGFVTASGLGFELRSALASRSWTMLALVLAVYVLLVWGVEAVSALLRRLAR